MAGHSVRVAVNEFSFGEVVVDGLPVLTRSVRYEATFSQVPKVFIELVAYATDAILEGAEVTYEVAVMGWPPARASTVKRALELLALSMPG